MENANYIIDEIHDRNWKSQKTERYLLVPNYWLSLFQSMLVQ